MERKKFIYHPDREAVDRERSKVEALISLFKEEYQIKFFVAIIGGSNETVDEQTNNWLMTEVVKLSSNDKIAIISGGTKGGLPEYALRIGRHFNLPTAIVYPTGGSKYVVPEDLYDLAIEVPKPIYGNVIWGSETPILSWLADVAIIVGGSKGTLIEYSTIKKSDKEKPKAGLLPTQIIVRKETGGVAGLIDILDNL